MFPWNTIEPTHVTLRLVPEILNTIDVIMAICKQLTMVDSVVPEFRHIQCIVAAPSIRIHNAIWYDFVLHDIHQCIRPSIGDHLRINLATAFEYAKYWHFTGCTTATFALAFVAEITLVYFNLTMKWCLVINGRANQFPEPMNSRQQSTYSHRPGTP